MAAREIDDARTALGLLHDCLQKWGDQEGFGHISEVRIGPYGVDIKFSCRLFGDFSLRSTDCWVSCSN